MSYQIGPETQRYNGAGAGCVALVVMPFVLLGIIFGPVVEWAKREPASFLLLVVGLIIVGSAVVFIRKRASDETIVHWSERGRHE